MTGSADTPDELPAAIWKRLMARIDDDSAAEVDRTAADAAAELPAGAWILRAKAAPWHESGVKGVRVKILSPKESADSAAENGESRRTLMIWIDPGCVYPGHHHPEAEETFVLEGDLRVGEFVLNPGDYQQLPGGTDHPAQTTKNGCLCLVICSGRQRL